MKKLIIMAVIAFSIAACDNTDKKTTVNTDSTDSAHQHMYACPMHPEVTGKEGDKCPKCGMALEHSDVKATNAEYRMDFKSEPSNIEAGKEIALVFTPKIKDKDAEQVPLDIEHEKKIHLIMVSEDLSWFDHQHPEYNSDGSYRLKYSFPQGGNHILFADYKPSGAGHQLEKINVEVKGKASATKTFKEARLKSKSGAYEITLNPGKSGFVSGSQLHIEARLTKDGKAADPNHLENYLGAKAHVVIIGMDEKNYMHVHPDVANGAFDLHATFDKPGVYRGWIQFQADGKIHTTDFVIVVSQGSSNNAAPHDDHGHGQDHKH